MLGWSKKPSVFAIMISGISVGLCVFSDEGIDVDKMLQSLYLPSRVSVFQYEQKGRSFPINTLRNLAMSKTQSSHLFIADIDVIPSGILLLFSFSISFHFHKTLYAISHIANLREEFLSLPSSYHRDVMHAFIVPLFETPFKSYECDYWYSCLQE